MVSEHLTEKKTRDALAILRNHYSEELASDRWIKQIRATLAAERKRRLLTRVMVALYQFAGVGANLLVYLFGPKALPVTALLMIPFDLTTRDLLHERWEGNRLYLRMAVLIVGGAALTCLVNLGAYRVALASFVAFVVAGTVDVAVYSALKWSIRLVRINGSNLLSAITDSLVFPLIAFGAVTPWIALSQSASKFLGGLVFSLVFVKWAFPGMRWRDLSMSIGYRPTKWSYMGGVRHIEEAEVLSASIAKGDE